MTEMSADFRPTLAIRPLKLRVTMCGSGDYPRIAPWPSSYLWRAIAQNIAGAAYEEPATIEDISRCTGIPAYYVEEELDTLLDHELMRKVGNKYQADFIIVRYDDLKVIDDILWSAGGELAGPMIERFHSIEDAIAEIHYYDAGKNFDEQLFTLIPIGFRECTDQSFYGGCPMPYPPYRKDGGRWFVQGYEYRDLNIFQLSHNSCDSSDKKAQINVFSTVKQVALPYTDKVDLLYQAAKGELDSGCIADDIKEGISSLVESKLLVKTPCGFSLKILHLNACQSEALHRILRDLMLEFRDVISAASERILAVFRKSVPEHLKEQLKYDGPFMCTHIGAYTIHRALKAGLLKPPESPETARVVLTEKFD
jgi:hypothetical protein